MVAEAGLITHAVIGATWTDAAVEFFIFKQEFRRVDIGRIHLIIYWSTGEDMVDTLPLALIAVGASDTIRAMSRLRKILEPMLTDLLEDVAVRPIVKIAGNQNTGIR